MKGFLGTLYSPLARPFSSFTAPFWSIVSFFVPFFTSTVEHSTSNDLSFGRLPPLSPLCGVTSTAIITSGVRPKRFHSHNDSCVRGDRVENIQLSNNRIPGSRKIPLYHALSLGAGSVESDVRVVNGSLLSGWSNDPNVTFEAQYVKPLESILDSRNPKGTGERRGIYDVAPELPLQLMVDLKSDIHVSFPMVHNALEPLRQKGYLTTYNRQKDKIEFSAITVIITTHANVLDQVEALEPRDMFLDAPLLDISNASYMPTLSPTAHMSYLGLFGGGWTIARHRERIRKLVSEAHAKGIMVRIWGIPNSPKWLRNKIWKMLLEEGVDWLNADDIDAAAVF